MLKSWNINNRLAPALYNDLLDQKHLLIAGATGSGKSVVIEGMLFCLAYSNLGDVPGGKNCILIDPKRVELSQWKKIPHCIGYASEPGAIVNALLDLMGICESRYIQMQSEGIKKYNGSDIYLFIDEFADLMTTNKKETAPIIQRLAQIGRAANIHIVLATQTPISKILPTEIKCNFDARLGLRTRSAQDSRNILDMAGLENLPPFGKGFLLLPGIQKYFDHYEIVNPARPREQVLADYIKQGGFIVQIPMMAEKDIKVLIEEWEKQYIIAFPKKYINMNGDDAYRAAIAKYYTPAATQPAKPAPKRKEEKPLHGIRKMIDRLERLP